MAVSKRPTQAKTKTSKPIAKQAPDGGSKSGLSKGASKTKSLDLNTKDMPVREIKPRDEEFVSLCDHALNDLRSLIKNKSLFDDAVCESLLRLTIHNIGYAMKSGSKDWLIYIQTQQTIGWLQCRAGIDIEKVWSDVKNSLTKNANKKRKEKSDLLKEKIELLAEGWIKRYPSKPATEIYLLMQSDLSSFATANGITVGLSRREVTSKISKVKNQAK